MISSLIGLLFIIGFVAIIACVLALAADKLLPNRSSLAKAICAALVAGFIPMLPIFVLVTRISGDPNPIAAIVPLLFGTLILAIFVGFPSSFFFIRRRSRARASKIDPGVFE